MCLYKIFKKKYSDCKKAYDGLVDYGAKAHYRVKHGENEFANGKYQQH